MKASHPKSLKELERRFSTEEDCINYLASIRWSDGFQCPYCYGEKSWVTSKKLWFCANCKKQISITTGTALHGTRKPLVLWLKVIWLLTESKKKVNANYIKKILNFGSYQTAWKWLNKLREVLNSNEDEIFYKEIYVHPYMLRSEKEKLQNVRRIVAVMRNPKMELLQIALLQEPVLQNFEKSLSHNISNNTKIYLSTRIKFNSFSESQIECRPKAVDHYNKAITSSLKVWLFNNYRLAFNSKYLDFYIREYINKYNNKANKKGRSFVLLLERVLENVN